MSAIETKAFKSGNSVAVRLPKGLGIAEGDRLRIERIGNEIRIAQAFDPAEEKRRLHDLVDALLALPSPDEIEQRDPDIFPDRPGLY